MTKTRFAPWLVCTCIGTLIGCTSGDQGTVGNTELNVMIPSGSSQSGPGAPEAFDIEVVEYTINCTGSDFDPTSNPDINSGPTVDQDVNLSGALEVLDIAGAPVPTPDFGDPLTEVYVWQGFMDIPANHACTVQLRARDGDGEVICTATEMFSVGADLTVKVNVLMICGISYQAPVGMLDLDGDFQFNVTNYCPDLFVENCVDPDLEEILVVPGTGAFAYTGCQVRFRDADDTCGENCDPQDCSDVTPEGLNCVPGPDNGVSGLVTCDSPGFRCAIPGALFGTPCTPAAGDTCFDLSGGVACAPSTVMNCGGISLDPSCSFAGDTLGSPGDPPPRPLAVGEGGFLVGCTVADNDGNPSTPPVPLAPGATVTCTAVVTDGDVDCDKTKQVQVFCPGLTPCQAAGPGFCDDGNDCTADSCNDSTGTAVCNYTNVGSGVACDTGSAGTPVPQPAFCDGAGECVSADCNAQPDPDGSCDDGNECTIDSCNPSPSTTCSNVANTGADCAGGTGTCNASGACIDNCVGISCSDGNQCTDDVCTSGGGGFTCTNPNDDTNLCNTCGESSCVCSGGACISGCTVPSPQDALQIPMACRNSFNQAVSVFPINLENVTPDACIEAGQPVNFDIDPVIALDTTFLQAAVGTLCATGSLLTVADVNAAQVSIDSVAGATCTEVLSGPIAQAGVVLDITEVPSGCNCNTIPCTSVTVNSGISLPLPPVTLQCSAAGTAGSEVQVCSTGEIPLSISLSDPAPPPAYQQTYVGVAAGIATVAFACNTSSTTSPPPGGEVQCAFSGNALPSTPSGQTCAAEVGTANVGETPFPSSTCDTATDAAPEVPGTCLLGGPAGTPVTCTGTCTAIPVAVDPSTVCATFTVQ